MLIQSSIHESFRWTPVEKQYYSAIIYVLIKFCESFLTFWMYYAIYFIWIQWLLAFLEDLFIYTLNQWITYKIDCYFDYSILLSLWMEQKIIALVWKIWTKPSAGALCPNSIAWAVVRRGCPSLLSYPYQWLGIDCFSVGVLLASKRLTIFFIQFCTFLYICQLMKVVQTICLRSYVIRSL